jgi:uncharacterized protein (TIGR02271 family)
MDQVYAGMTVQGATGPIGMVEAVDNDPTTGNPRVVVQRNDGERFALAPGMFRVVGDVLHMTGTDDRGMGFAGSGTATSGSFDPLRTQELSRIEMGEMNLAPGDEMRIPVVREEAVIRTQEVERGGVRINKTVNEREEVIEHPTMREDVDVERVSIGRVVDAMPQVREEGDTLIIPVLEEMLVVEKRLVLKEEIRVTRRRTTEVEQARVVLSEEQVTIERLDDRTAGQ